ncbi:D(2) dopamine receptor A-like [Toxotes jaculatrix]|uniref:D(2) dopamine receptor A-like n=1 Tax=Toxotes jaculatrix TaxID=941984 RepID=UPI001B3AA98B|nr:D(2) dopamine receptor A-like [Toxotes jaculatrix]
MRAEPTPAWDSGNNTIWEEYIDITFVVANSLILLITCIVGIAANIFVILAVYHQKSLQTSNNALVVSLAIIDILRCVIDCPILLTIVTAVHQNGHADELICDAQVASFSFSCCIQLLTLACISAERYQAIAQPFKTSQRRKRIMVLIPVTWTLAILVAVFCLMFVKDSPVHMRCKKSQSETSSSYDTFGLYILLPLWAACFSVIIGFYARIFILVRSHNRKIFDKGTFPLSKKHKTQDKQKKEETTVENGKSGQNQKLSKSVAHVEPVTQVEPNSAQKDSSAVLLTSTKAAQCVSSSEKKKELKNTVEITDLETEQPCPPAMQVAVQTKEKPFKTEQSNPCATRVEAKPSNEGSVGSVKNSATKPQKVSSNFDTESQSKEKVKSDEVPSEMKESSPHVPSSAQLEKPESTSVLLTEQKQAKNNDGGETLAITTVDQTSSLPPVSGNAPETEAPKQNLEVEGAVCIMPSKANRDRANKKKEGKMAKRAGYIIVTFLLFWLPLITTIVVNFVVHKNKNIQIKIIQDVEILSVSVACITSLSDPIIYAAVNPQFRSEFYRLKNKVKSTFNFMQADFSAVSKHCREEALHAVRSSLDRCNQLSGGMLLSSE